MWIYQSCILNWRISKSAHSSLKTAYHKVAPQKLNLANQLRLELFNSVIFGQINHRIRTPYLIQHQLA